MFSSAPTQSRGHDMFSVLMAVYHKDSPIFFEQAVRSITCEQTVSPDELVIVCDGPLPQGLSESLTRIRAPGYTGACAVTIVQLSENKGLASALNAGLRVCRNDLVLRMDSDDYSWANRIEKTISLINENAQCAMYGFAYQVFDNDVNEPYAMRIVQERVDVTTRRDFLSTPINHPTICLRRKIILAAGGYSTEVGRFEDWELTLRLKKMGGKIVNSKDPVLSFRAPKKIMLRRGGVSYAIEEIKALHMMYKLGLMPFAGYLLNVCLRAPVRLIPLFARYFIYKNFVWR